MTELEVFFSGLYRTRCAFGNLERFLEVMPKVLDASGGSKQSAISRLNEAIEELRRVDDHLEDDSGALQLLIADDLSRISRTMSSLDTIDALSEEGLNGDLDFYLDEFASLGADVKRPFFTVVDSFPRPFDRFRWSAFCPDKEDEEKFGIKRGIYLLRARLRPAFSTSLLAHELIHAVPGERDPFCLAMGLEEGIAEIIGALLLAGRRLGPEAAANIFISRRHASSGDQLSKLYLDHTRQAAILYRHFGIDGLITLLNQGRNAIHDAEVALLRGEIEALSLPKGSSDNDLDRLLDDALDSYPAHYVFHPLGCYLLAFVAKNRTLAEICERAQVSETVGKEVLRKISSDTALFVLSDESVAYSNVEFYRDRISSTIFRYDLS